LRPGARRATRRPSSRSRPFDEILVAQGAAGRLCAAERCKGRFVFRAWLRQRRKRSGIEAIAHGLDTLGEDFGAPR
jgi:hypothetical protein